MKTPLGCVAAVLLCTSARLVGEGPVPPEAPKLRLPAGSTPLRYAAELWIDPSKETFKGRIRDSDFFERGVRHALAEREGAHDRSRRRPSRRRDAKDAIPAEASAEGKDYVRIHFQRNLSPGDYDVDARLHGPRRVKDTEGVFRQKEGGDWYVFTPVRGDRRAPRVPVLRRALVQDALAAHAPRAEGRDRRLEHARRRPRRRAGRRPEVRRFAPTKPLPSYLVAFAVGPFEVVDAGTAGRNRSRSA